MDGQTPHRESPVMNTKEAADYVRRTPAAMKMLRHKRRGPNSFKQDGRIYYYVTELDRWLAEGAASDSRSNPDLDPTTKAPEPRTRRRPRKTVAPHPVPAPAKSAA